MGDVNNLKVTNDTLGHAKGDELIKASAHIIKSGCRKEDIVARIGGDEFVVLLSKTPDSTVEQIVEDIRKSLTESKAVYSYPVSISLGWITKESSDQDIEELFLEAEKEMYKNKIKQKQDKNL